VKPVAAAADVGGVGWWRLGDVDVVDEMQNRRDSDSPTRASLAAN